MKYDINDTRDRMIHGIIAGLAGAVLQSSFALAAKALHFTDRVFIDYAEILVLGRDPGGVASLIGVVGHLTNAAVWGIIFRYIMKFSRKKYYVLKGLGLGIFIWLFSLGLATMYKLPRFEKVPTNASYVLLIGAMIWGVTMALVYKYLERKSITNSLT